MSDEIKKQEPKSKTEPYEETEEDRKIIEEVFNNGLKMKETKKTRTDEEECFHSCSDDEDEESNKTDTKISDVVIDEEALKLAETKLSENEKQERMEKAIEKKEEGNTLFKSSQWAEAEMIYTEALQCCLLSDHQLRSVLFSNRAAAFIKLEKNEQAVEDLNKSLSLNDTFVRARLRRADLHEKMDNLEEALEDYKKVLEIDPSSQLARAACLRLPEKIKIKTEKMKEEVFGKLKELGNMVLKPFGLSTENFQVQQNPDTGSYSINMKS